MKRYLLLFILLIILWGCKPCNQTPEKVTTAPDGTILWKTCDDGRIIHFSSKGTYYEDCIPDGKGINCERKTVPNTN